MTDELKAGDLYIEAPPEMVARMTARPAPGIRRDVDKDPAKMTEEEKDEGAEYAELEDDFLMLANEG